MTFYEKVAEVEKDPRTHTFRVYLGWHFNERKMCDMTFFGATRILN